MAQVYRKDKESLERLISRFRRVVIRKGVLKQVRRSRYFSENLSKEMKRRKAIFREKRRKLAIEK